VIQGAKKRVGFIAGKVAMFSAYEHLITCPQGVLRVGGGSKKHQDFYKPYCPVMLHQE